MESSICVAVMTGLPARLHFRSCVLNQWNFLCRNLYAEVATGYHQAVGYFEDFIQVVNALLVLDFGDDLDVLAIMLLQQFANFKHVTCFTNEGSGNKIDALFDPENDIVGVFSVMPGEKSRLPVRLHLLLLMVPPLTMRHLISVP